MFQTVQIEAQSEQQGLADLHAQRATRCACRELALYRTEQALDQGPEARKALRKCPPHLAAHSAHTPGFLPALGGDDALCPELLADISVIPLAVEFGVGQHQSDTRLLRSRSDNRRQIAAVVPRAAPRELRQHELLIQIHGDHPLQPVSPRQRFLPV